MQADCTRLAGVTEWLQVAALARSFNVPVVPHHADMMRVHQHLSSALNASPMLEVIPWLQDIFEEPLRIGTAGSIRPRRRAPRRPCARTSSRSIALPEAASARTRRDGRAPSGAAFWPRLGALQPRARALRRQEAIAGYVAILPWLLGFVIFSAGPIVVSFVLMFMRWEVLTPPSLEPAWRTSTG